MASSNGCYQYNADGSRTPVDCGQLQMHTPEWYYNPTTGAGHDPYTGAPTQDPNVGNSSGGSSSSSSSSGSGAIDPNSPFGQALRDFANQQPIVLPNPVAANPQPSGNPTLLGILILALVGGLGYLWIRNRRGRGDSSGG